MSVGKEVVPCAHLLKEHPLLQPPSAGFSHTRVVFLQTSQGWFYELAGGNTSASRQPPTIVTWAKLHFYDLPFCRD